MLYKLVLANENHPRPGNGWTLELPATVGRSRDIQVCIDDESISRSHCQLLLGPDEALQVRDMGSLNGTYVNGERIKGIHTVIPGDMLQIGAISLRIEYASDTDPGPSAPKPTRTTLNATQPMTTYKKPKFTMEVIKEPTKKWWEFWKE